MGEKKEKAFELPDGKVTVKFVKRKVGMAAGVGDDHVISGGMLEGATKRFAAPMTRSGGIKNILTKAEKDFFEGEIHTGQNLSSYGDFWKQFYVRIEKSGMILDLSNPADYLKYKLLLGWDSIIAPSLKQYKESPLATYQFYMEMEGEDMRMKSKSLNITKTAWKNFNKVEDDAETLAAIIFLMTGKKVAGNAKLTYLNTQVEKLVDAKPEKFNDLIADTHFDSKIFVANAERAGIIIKTKTGYETKDGLPVTAKGKANSIDNVVNFVLDPVNNEVKELILSRLENIKE